MQNLIEVTSIEHWESLRIFEVNLALLYFYADWFDVSVQFNEQVKILADQNPSITFVKIEAEKFSEISQKLQVDSIPTFFILKEGNIVDRLIGANPPELTKKIDSILSQITVETSQLNDRIKNLISSKKIMLFIKGTPERPRCGFSKDIISIIEKYKVDYGTFDILSDPAIRKGLKDYSNWPTYPQLYVNGNLIGGLDIVRELEEQESLKETLTGTSN